MAIMAKWRDKEWEVSPKKVNAIQNLSFGYEQKAEDNKATEGVPLTNERGLEMFSITFSNVLHSGAGVDPRKEIESWEKLVTKTGKFFLNGKQLGPTLQLRKVNVSNITLDDLGRMRLATLTFTLKEYEDVPTPVLPDSTTSLNVGAQTVEKEEKKPDNNQAEVAPVSTLKVGSYVKPTGDKYFTGQTIPQWVKDKSHVVSQIKGEKTLLGNPDGINSWVYTNELTLV